MRIVLSYTSRKWGGVHTVTEMLARGFLSRGHDVKLFGSPGTMIEERMKSVVPFEPILGGMDFNPRAIVRAVSALRKFRAEVVLTLTRKDVALTGPAAYATRIPVVVRHPNQQPLGNKPHFRLLYGVIAGMHITNANATRETLLESAAWLSPEKVRVIYNGVDPRPFLSADPLSLELGKESIAIGYVGSFEARKGVIELARAWPAVAKALPNAHLLLCGKGAKEERMREILQDAPRVHWLGHRKDVASVMKSLDLLVLPSHVEGAPNVVLEAMAAGPAIVATSVSGTPELVRDGIEARLIPAHDEHALVGALVEVASDPEMRRRMSAMSKLRVEKEFTIPRMIDEYEEVLREITL
ncbi:MAG: glycosyltransferase family 4 protein [Gemmatimonadales bacterium]